MNQLKSQLAKVETEVEAVAGRVLNPRSAQGTLVSQGRVLAHWQYNLNRLFGWTITVNGTVTESLSTDEVVAQFASADSLSVDVASYC
jgi:hypothetical protein